MRIHRLYGFLTDILYYIAPDERVHPLMNRMHAALQDTTMHTLLYVNEYQQFLQPVPAAYVKSKRALKTQYTASAPSFLFNEKGTVSEQQLHMDQRWSSTFFEDFLGNLSVFVSFPVDRTKREQYQINIIKGSHIANRLMSIATSEDELRQMRTLFQAAGLAWDEEETILECPWSHYIVASSQIFHGGSKKRDHLHDDKTVLAFTYVQSPFSAAVNVTGAPPGHTSKFHEIMFPKVSTSRWHLLH